MEKVQKSINEKQEWFSRMCSEIQKLQKTSDPPVLASQFMQEKDQFWQMASKILNKPKPKVEPPPPAPADPAAAAAKDTEKKDAAGSDKPSENGDTAAPKDTAAAPGEMDVD